MLECEDCGHTYEADEHLSCPMCGCTWTIGGDEDDIDGLVLVPEGPREDGDR